MDEQAEAIRSWIGLDVGKGDHHATVLGADGAARFDRPVRNERAAMERLADDAGERAALVIDQPGSIAALAIAVARQRGVPVACVGLVMRRASELYPGEAKTDRRDSFVIADTARIHQARVHWLADNDELRDELRVLGGYDDDLAHDRTRTANRLRDLLLQASRWSSGSSAPGLSTRRSGRCLSAIRPRQQCGPPDHDACSDSLRPRHHPIPHARTSRRLRRPGPSHSPIWPLDSRRAQVPPRQPPPQERALALSVLQPSPSVTTTPASTLRTRSTTPPSCVSPAAAATSSTGC